ncbi:hypothetical protein HDR63_02685 [bacterium]|nr:hypothetical protein [bacterium]
MSKQMQHFVGYMLGRDDAPARGMPWTPKNQLVFVCASLMAARRVMDARGTAHGWSHIYRVHAQDFQCFYPCAAMFWTRMADHLIVDDLVWVSPRYPYGGNSVDDLAARARACRRSFVRAQKSWNQRVKQ